MITAFKKLTSGKRDGEIGRPPHGLQAMSLSLQKKFSKGVQYNMKILIKGDRNVGKTCLFHRLQGHKFVENYTPTEEIQVTSIQWSYKVTDDVVKVEVWDVVDKGKKRAILDNLKIEQSLPNQQFVPALDAEFLDVYKGANGVILVLDITKPWTFEYVQREFDKIPDTIPVLVLGNHCDMAHHRTVTPEHVSFYVESLNRTAPVRYAESSMYNGFGLKFLHKWFNLPFLQLQRETLLAQLITNEHEINITAQELDVYQQSDDANYSKFIDKLSIQRRRVADSKSMIPPPIISHAQAQSTSDVPICMQKIKQINSLQPTMSSTLPKSDKSNTSIENRSHNPNKVYGKGQEIIIGKQKAIPETLITDKLHASFGNIEEFIPDESLDKSFLEESTATVANISQNYNAADNSDSEAEVEGNPLVSELQDDLDPSDEFTHSDYWTIPDVDNEVSTTSSSYNNWTRNSERRPSPDGIEDNTSDLINNDNKINNDEPDAENEDKKSKNLKSKNGHKEKPKKKKTVKKEMRYSKEQNELEEFLNTTPDAFYEQL